MTMKRTLTILAASLLAAICVSAQDKQHSIEITTGYPSIVHFAEYPWTYRTIEMQWNGQTYKEHYQPGINIGHTYQWRKRWEVRNADPTTTRQTDIYGAFCASVRYKWLVRDNYEANISAATTFGMAGIGIRL